MAIKQPKKKLLRTATSSIPGLMLLRYAFVVRNQFWDGA